MQGVNDVVAVFDKIALSASLAVVQEHHRQNQQRYESIPSGIARCNDKALGIVQHAGGEESKALLDLVATEHTEGQNPKNGDAVEVAWVGKYGTHHQNGTPQQQVDVLVLPNRQGHKTQKQGPHDAGGVEHIPYAVTEGQCVGYMGNHGADQQPQSIFL